MSSYVDTLCQFCWHEDDLHEFGPSQRTPTKTETGFFCSDCVGCEGGI